LSLVSTLGGKRANVLENEPAEHGRGKKVANMWIAKPEDGEAKRLENDKMESSSSFAAAKIGRHVMLQSAFDHV
jgi:hypothetical protein